MPETFIPIAFFAAAFGVIYMFFRTRNMERMALIEKGADASSLQMKPRKGNTLKFGLFLFGAGLGILMGSLLEATTNLKEEVCYFSMIFLFSGLGLIVYYLIDRKKGIDE